MNIFHDFEEIKGEAYVYTWAIDEFI